MNPNIIKLTHREYVWLFAIVLIGLLLRFAAIVAFNHAPESDEIAYKSMALNLVNGNGIIDNMGNHAMYNVGYPLFILAPVFSLFGESLLVARLLNIILGGVDIVLCYLIAKEVGANTVGRLSAATIWALYLPSAIYGVYLAKENLMIPLMLGIIWCLMKLLKKPAGEVASLCGILFGFLAMTGNAGLSLAGLVLLPLSITSVAPIKKTKLAVSMVIAAMLVVSPWVMRNMRVIGAPVLNTNGGFNLYLGNNPAATGWFVSIADTPRGATWNDLRKLGEVQASETLKREAIEWIKEHPNDFLMLALKKVAYFWMPPFHDGKGQNTFAEKAVRILWAIQFLFVLAAALGSLLIGTLRNRPYAVLWMAVAFYTVAHMPFYVIFRYRLPIMPVVGIIAALAIESFFKMTSAKSDAK